MAMSLANAIIYNHKDVVETLLKKKVDVNETDEYGYTPIIEAAIADHTDIAELLLKNGAKVNATDVVGSTALHWAVENYNLALCKLLLNHGADPNAYTKYGQPILVKPLLRHQQDLKELLYQHGADLKFAQDYINTKLIAHRFELIGRADIIDSAGKFIEIDLEGFVLEFTLNIVLDSLIYFKNNFAARNLREHFNIMQRIIDAFATAAELIKYQQYLVKIDQHQERINNLIAENDLLLLPMGCQGHAITFIKYGNLWAKCDRGENSQREPTVQISKINNLKALNSEFIKTLLYKKHHRDFVNHTIAEILELEPIASLPIKPQITGNCSWANIEAAVPTVFFMLLIRNKNKIEVNKISEYTTFAMSIFKQWREWDKDRALHDCIENFYSADTARKAAIATILASLLFQTCNYNRNEDLARINKILNVFANAKEYKYILQSYLKIYTKEFKTEAGNNFLQILDIAET